MTSAFHALTTDVAVEMTTDLALADVARAIVSTYAPAVGAPALRYALSPTEIVRDGEVIARCDDPTDVVPRFELDLYEQVIARAAPGWLLHAAAVVIDGEAIVFAGPSGAGKTTLALELVRRGHGLLTEEVVWIDPAGRACGLARPLHIVASSEPANLPASWPRVDYPLQTRTRVWPPTPYQLVVPPPVTYAHGPLPVRALVKLTHGPDRDSGLTALRPADAIQRFWDCAFRNDDASLTIAVALSRRIPGFRLASKTFAEALAGVEDLLTRK